MNKFLFTILFSVISVAAMAQLPGRTPAFRPMSTTPTDTLNYNNPKEYIIGDVTISGAKHLEKDILLQIAKVSKGDKITLPGEANANIIKAMYAQQLFDDVQLNVTRINLD